MDAFIRDQVFDYSTIWQKRKSYCRVAGDPTAIFRCTGNTSGRTTIRLGPLPERSMDVAVLTIRTGRLDRSQRTIIKERGPKARAGVQWWGLGSAPDELARPVRIGTRRSEGQRHEPLRCRQTDCLPRTSSPMAWLPASLQPGGTIAPPAYEAPQLAK